MILQHFAARVGGIEAKLAAGPCEFEARKRLTLAVSRLGLRLFDGRHRVAWCGIATPYDLLGALGVTSCFVEFVGSLLAGNGLAPEMLAAAEQAGYSADSCGYHRAVLAAAEAGLIPRPDFLIATSGPCSGGLAVIQQLARHFGKELFVLHVPPDDRPESVAYLADQYRSMIEFVASHTGAAADAERIRTALARTNRAREAMVRLLALSSAVPSPARRRDLADLGITLPLLFGRDDAVEVAESYCRELRATLDRRDPETPREPIRLLWMQNRIQFRSPVEEILERDFGAAVVADELNDITWEPIDLAAPLSSLARRALSFPLMLPAERRLSHLVAMAERWRIDGLIHPCHWGCRQGTGVRGLMSRGLAGHRLPVLNLEVDCVDSRNFAEGQLRTRLEAFVEMLSQRRR